MTQHIRTDLRHSRKQFRRDLFQFVTILRRHAVPGLGRSVMQKIDTVQVHVLDMPAANQCYNRSSAKDHHRHETENTKDYRGINRLSYMNKDEGSEVNARSMQTFQLV